MLGSRTHSGCFEAEQDALFHRNGRDQNHAVAANGSGPVHCRYHRHREARRGPGWVAGVVKDTLSISLTVCYRRSNSTIAGNNYNHIDWGGNDFIDLCRQCQGGPDTFEHVTA